MFSISANFIVSSFLALRLVEEIEIPRSRRIGGTYGRGTHILYGQK